MKTMMILRVIAIGTVILILRVIRADETTSNPIENPSTKVNSLNDRLGWIGDGITNVVNSIVPTGEGVELFEGRTMCRKRKKHKKHTKYLVPLLLGFVLIKSILLPVALKSLAVLSGKAVILSLMSLILAAIVGLRRVAQGVGFQPSGFSYDGYSKYRRKDQLEDRNNLEEEDPYRYYRDRRRRK